ncbi:MAG: ATP-binding protein [Elusimicrobia bacterium]|nr:ATP-binding protein [Elusimicrobiota bacterium]
MAAETRKFPINAAASVIADISAGIYRTPAGALKELVTNAFDADANMVQVSTNAPHFGTFTCSDDGTGMTPEQFEQNMGLIGGSSKRDHGEVSPINNRPLVGRIGIGILSIGQICRRFEVFSSAKGSPIKFRAKINLEPYMRPEARRVQLNKPLSGNDKVEIGKCEMDTAPEDPEKHYTRVVMDSIIPGFRQQLQSSPMGKMGVTPKIFKKGDMEAFLRSVSHDTVSEHGAYAQLIWELASTTPIRYLPGGPIRDTPSLDDLRKRMESFKFSVFLDGVELFKPLLLPLGAATDFKVYPKLDFTTTLSDKRTLRVRGYIYWQQSRILPRELQGILVRVRNVGIGTFDPTYLKYPKHEGWKFSQLCGEIYVDDGLDEAINIDRASFRESDEAYLSLQEFLFQRLGKKTDEGAGIFTSIKAMAKKAADRKKQKEHKKRANETHSAIFGSPGSMTLETAASKIATPAGVRLTRRSLVVDEELVATVPTRHRDLFMGICGVVEKTIGDRVPPAVRRDLLQRIAKLFEIR